MSRRVCASLLQTRRCAAPRVCVAGGRSRAAAARTHPRHVLAVQRAVRFGPPHFPRVALHLEVLVALGAAEAEHLAVVAHEADAVPGVHRAAAEEALVQTHRGGAANALTAAWSRKKAELFVFYQFLIFNFFRCPLYRTHYARRRTRDDEFSSISLLEASFLIRAVCENAAACRHHLGVADCRKPGATVEAA